MKLLLRKNKTPWKDDDLIRVVRAALRSIVGEERQNIQDVYVFDAQEAAETMIYASGGCDFKLDVGLLLPLEVVANAGTTRPVLPPRVVSELMVEIRAFHGENRPLRIKPPMVLGKRPTVKKAAGQKPATFIDQVKLDVEKAEARVRKYQSLVERAERDVRKHERRLKSAQRRAEEAA